ncbi:alpha-amylase family glycosyl hydrolase [Hymenobacter koreensis]|uniref:Glycosyl hydrolase family 13 catalytic domain-containing protein n=1 Tax=Hymenobacter koreensis TaxID=1084523 RepID=A0ABP8IYK0_9BACT
MKILRLLGLLLLLISGAVQAQVVTTQPVFFRETDPVTIIFDASQGNGALAGFTGPVYIWTGVVTNLSATNTSWRHVKSPSFGTADPAAEMTSLGNNRWSITFTPRTFYPVPANETILRLGMIFKNANGSIVGRASDGGDIFVDVFQGGYAVRITSPPSGGNPQFVASGTTVNVTGVASSSASQLSLLLNNVQVGQQANAGSISANITLSQSGRNVVRLRGTSSALSASDSVVFIVRPAVTTAALPAGTKDGITYLSSTSVRLKLTAPGKQFVYVLGEFNNWQAQQATYMNRTPDGNDWWVDITGLTPGQEYAYQYLVDGELRVADPYAEKILDPNNDRFIPAVTYPNLKPYPTGQTSGIVSVLQTNQTPYQWTTTGYTRPKKTDLVLYELHLRDFIARHDYQTLRDTLDYLQRLGINAIELMPVNEFEGNDSWGYNPSFYFAPDKYYGTKNELKRLIDECHRRGMAVVLDMVLNHSFGQSPMVQMYFDGTRPTANSPWFNRDATHPFNVGYDFNHESPFTRYFSKRVMEFWLQEYRIDGYRFDLSKGFTQRNTPNDVGAWGAYDQSRINIWLDYHSHLTSVDPNVFNILEHFADNSEERVLADAGMMLWGNMTHNYNEATMGYLAQSDFGGVYHGARNWSQPNLVGYMESHDEERLMYKNLTFGNQANPAHNVRDLNVGLARNEAAAAFFFTVPGPKMIWQFGELGYDFSINACPNGTIDPNCRVANKPIRWDYQQNANRQRLYNVYRNLITLRTTQPVFENPTTYVQRLSGAAKSIHLSDANLSVAILGNFDVTSTTIDPRFQSTGKWYNYMTGDSITVTNTNALLTLQPGEYRVFTSRRITRPAVITTTRAARQAAALGLSVAPNPAQATATVRLTLSSAAPVQVSVTNVIGSEVRRITLPGRQAAGTVEVGLPLQGLAPGLYLVKVQAGTASATTRLLVQP